MDKLFSKRETSRFYCSRLFILSFAASLICLLFLFPSDYLMGIGRYWENPANEVNISLAGLRYYVSENLWFPLGYVKSINTPEGINILYTNSYPLIAFLAKIINLIVGVKINFIHIWSLVCTLLQGISFAFLMTALNIRKGSIIFLSSIAGMLMPPYLWRLENTLALPHFFILFALAYYFIIARKESSPIVIRRAIIISSVMVVLSFLTHLYITAIIIPIYFMSLLSAMLARKIKVIEGLKAVFFTALGMVIVGYLFGYFYGKTLSTDVGGFDFFSMNMGAPFDPSYSSLFKMIKPDLKLIDATGGQCDAMQYLGLGWLFLIILAGLLYRQHIIKFLRDYYLLMILLFTFVLFSFSNKIYFGNVLLFQYHVPDVLVHITNIFRAPGRFFWPVGYFLVAIAIASIAKKMSKSSLVIFCAAILLQLADTYEIRHTLWTSFRGENTDGIPAGKWNPPYSLGGVSSTFMSDLIKNHKSIKQYPSWWCGGVGNQLFEINMNYAGSKYGVSQNSFYTARSNKDCYAEDLEVHHLSTLAPETLYIFGQRYANAEQLYRQGVDLSACRILNAFDIQANSGYSNNLPIICSGKIKSKKIDLASASQGWNVPYGGLCPIEQKKFASIPIVRKVTASGSLNEFHRPENLITSRSSESDKRFPEYWLAPDKTDGWVQLDLNDFYHLSEIRILNTANGDSGDRMADSVNVVLLGKNGIAVHIDKVKVNAYPKWTSIKVNTPISISAVKVFVYRGKVDGVGLNKIQLVGTKVS